MSFSFGGGGFGPSAYSTGLTFGSSGAPGTMQSGLSSTDVERAAGTIAVVADAGRRVFDAIRGNTPSGDAALTYTGTQTGAQTGTQQVGGSLSNVLGNILDTLKRTGESAVRGALQGAEATSAGASQGAAFGSGVTSLNTTLLLGGGLALVLLLRK